MKIIEIERKGNRSFFKLFGCKLFSYSKKKMSPRMIYEYLTNNYSYIFDKEEIRQDEVSLKYQDCIWQYWAQGVDSAPELVKKCYKTIDEHCATRKIIRLDDSNIENYIEIPDFIKEKLEKGIISKAHFSDYLRTCLLVKYGGTWIDSTVFLTGKIDNEIVKSDFFVFKSLSYYECKFVPSLNLLKLLYKNQDEAVPTLCLSNWFIHSKPDNYLLKSIKYFLEEYWEKKDYEFDYFFYHYFFTFAIMSNDDCKKIYNDMPNYANRNPHLLQKALFQPYEDTFFGEIKSLSNIHKLTHKKKRGKKEKSNLFIDYLLSN